MNNFRTQKIIAFFLAVLMILPLIPVVDLTVFAEGNALTLEGEPVFAPMDDTLATINKNEITVYYGYENGNTGITVSGVRGAHIYLTQSVSYNGTIVLYEAFTTDSALIPYINAQYKYVLASDVNLGGDPLPEETTTAPETTITPETTPEETTTAPETTTTPETPVTPSLTLDFLPAGLIAESETVSGTATINGTSVVVYKSLDNGAAGVAISVVSGTQVTLVTKYTFTTAEGAKLVFYRYDYNGDNTDLANAAISETGGYPFIYAGSLITTPVPTEKTDSATGVKINADLPEGVALTVTPKQLAEVGLNTNIYPVGASSLFYDVTLLLNNAEYQPTNGITVTFPESAILASGIAVGDSYHVYHIHEGAVEMRKAAVYNGGDLALTFTGLSAVGIAETEIKKNFITDEGAVVSYSDYLDRVAATIKVDSAILYDYFEENANGMTVSGILNYPIVLTQKIQYSTTGFVLYRFEYILDSTDTNYDENFYNIVNGAGAHYEYIPADYVTIGTIPSVILENNTKVKIKADQTAINLYSDPSTNVSDMVTVDAALLDGIYKISGTYTDVTTNALYYRLECCTHFSWPADYGMYTYVLSTVVEETDQGIASPIVDFCNPAPIMGYTSQIQPRSAIYSARSAIARASLYSTDSLLSTAAEGTSSSDSLKLSKDVKDNNDGTYTITLEAYTTGTVTVKQTTKPMDIVLVLDQSGSMAYCIECGNELSYHDVDDEDVVTTGIYYRKKSGFMSSSYVRLYYCSQCDGWHESQTCSGYKYTKNNTNFYEACSRRYDALITALNSFVTAVKEKTVDSNGNTINHRIAIVGFSSDDFNNTELLTGVTINAANRINDNNANYYPRDNKAYNGVQYGSITPAQYQAALQDMSTTAGQTSVEEAIKALTAHGGTETLDGLDMAYQILSNDIKKTEDREKVVILFTDGATNSTRSAVLNKAYDIKDDFGATVYSVGIFDGANGNLNSYTGDITNNNSLMHVISSNYPTAYYRNGSVQNDDVDDRNPLLTGDNSYYLSASDATALNNIFKEMSSQIGGTLLPLDSTTVVKDIITPQFTLPANASNVAVSQVNCTSYNSQTGAAEWGDSMQLDSASTVSINEATHSVDVTGFDFAHNYVAENGRDEWDDTKAGTFHGRKLVIVFTITPDPDFLGGDGVATNGTQSGIYSKGEPIAFFPPGSVSVPLKDISTIVKNKHIYYGNTTDLTGILDLWAISRADQNKALPVDVDGINNAYVKLLYTIKLNDSTIAQYYVPAGEAWGSENCVWSSNSQTKLLQNYQALEDTGFSVECSMISAANTGNVKSTTGSATVYVYKPTLVFKDSEQKYKDSLKPYNADTGIDGFLESHWDEASTVWSHSSQTATPEGEKPEFTFAYTYTNTNAFTGGEMLSTKDVPVSVTVTVNGRHPDGTKATPVSGDGIVTIINTATGAYCVHKGCTGLSSGVHFIVHVTQAITSLTIEKEGWNTVDPNQTFLFTVTGSDAEGQQINLTVTVHENGSVTIDGLIIGNEYTITEDANWSWRYSYGGVDSSTGVTITNDKVSNGVKVKLGESGNVITFNNTRDKLQWLDGDSWLDNLFSLFGN